MGTKAPAAQRKAKKKKLERAGKGVSVENNGQDGDVRSSSDSDSSDSDSEDDNSDEDDEAGSDEEPPSDFEDDEPDNADFQAVGRSKSMDERLAAKGTKAGHKGRFHGAQLDLLLEHEQAYRDVPKGKRGKNKRLKEFMTAFRALFWQKFPWRLVRADMGEKYQRAKRTEVIQRTNKVSRAR